MLWLAIARKESNRREGTAFELLRASGNFLWRRLHAGP
jgi:hypothetical protein